MAPGTVAREGMGISSSSSLELLELSEEEESPDEEPCLRRQIFIIYTMFYVRYAMPRQSKAALKAVMCTLSG